MGRLRRDLAGAVGSGVVGRWVRARPLDAAWRLGAVLVVPWAAFSLLDRAGAGWAEWVLYGGVPLLAGLLQPDLEPYRRG